MNLFFHFGLRSSLTATVSQNNNEVGLDHTSHPVLWNGFLYNICVSDAQNRQCKPTMPSSMNILARKTFIMSILKLSYECEIRDTCLSY